MTLRQGFLILLSYLLIFFLAPSSIAQNQTSLESSALTEENFYEQFAENILQGEYSNLQFDSELPLCQGDVDVCLSPLEVKIQALDELSTHSDDAVRVRVQNEARRLSLEVQDMGESLQLYVVYVEAGGSPDVSWQSHLQNQILIPEVLRSLPEKAVYTLVGYPKIFGVGKWTSIRTAVEALYPHWLRWKSQKRKMRLKTNPAAMADLLNLEPALDQYKSGLYKNKPRIYMFCREDRRYPCMMVMKNSDGSWRSASNGKGLWSQPSLGYSRHKKEYNQSNGNTPSGIFRIDSVMPEADKTLVFGKFRRLVLNFVAKSEQERDYKLLLPPSHYGLTWWQQAVVARDMGRGLFRIHGTGLGSSSFQPYYPLVPTSGCVAKRENKHNGTQYVDQRLLLDELMSALNLSPIFENETKIRGLLYVVNLDNQKAPVTLAEIAKLIK